jgi:hypothetical protein
MPPYIPPVLCEPPVFRTLYRLNARRALRLEATLYLCVLRARDEAALERHLRKHLCRGELYCRMEPGVYYLQIFALREEAAQVLLCDITECVPGVTAQMTPVPKGD